MNNYGDFGGVELKLGLKRVPITMKIIISIKLLVNCLCGYAQLPLSDSFSNYTTILYNVRFSMNL